MSELDKTSACRMIEYPCKYDRSLQKALILPAEGKDPRPLLVALHTWSFSCDSHFEGYEKAAAEYNWHMIFPEFRGPNWTLDACGSDAVVSDIEDAVAYMKGSFNVDPDRVYLVGGSGGGHASLLLAGRRPDLFTAVSSWCPISDIARWHGECKKAGRDYFRHIEMVCGGDPVSVPSAAREALIRSPRTWLVNAARRKTPVVDISTGIHDGHTGSVPIGHAIRAYNEIAAPEDRISEDDIMYMEEHEEVPAHLKAAEGDPAYGSHTVYLRKQSGNVRLTIFEGGHDRLPDTAAEWLARQAAGKAPDFRPGAPVEQSGDTALSK